MAANIKRFTISITPSMEMDLKLVKKECYCKDTQNDMLRDLIVRGLASLQSGTEEAGSLPEQST